MADEDGQLSFRYTYGIDQAPSWKRPWLCSICGAKRNSGRTAGNLSLMVCSSTECNANVEETMKAYLAWFRKHINGFYYPNDWERLPAVIAVRRCAREFNYQGE